MLDLRDQLLAMLLWVTVLVCFKMERLRLLVVVDVMLASIAKPSTDALCFVLIHDE